MNNENITDKAKTSDQKLNFGIDVIELTQNYIIKKYAMEGKILERMSNDEFEESYCHLLNDSERDLLKALSAFWTEEIWD